MEKLQLANTVLMVRPIHFAFNAETADDNEFQHESNLSSVEVREKAMLEFDSMVAKLTAAGLQVLVLEDSQDGEITPDEVFPNNWFFADHTGRVTTFPMLTPNRQKEIRLDQLIPVLENHQFSISEINRLDQDAQGVLEGTGAIVFDHQNNLAYGAISNRCEQDLFETYCRQLGYHPIAFKTHSAQGKAIYHTNVLMSVGLGFAVVCDEVIDHEYRDSLLRSLEANQQVIRISEDQMTEMCGNILHVQSLEGSSKIILSQRAYSHFSATQRAQLMEFGELIVCDIPTIETIGGGSARCMVAEIFLPKNS